jgi:hypothetical protein
MGNFLSIWSLLAFQEWFRSVHIEFSKYYKISRAVEMKTDKDFFFWAEYRPLKLVPVSVKAGVLLL